MLHGRRVHLRPVREADLDALYAAHTEIRNRGPYFPLGVKSEPAFRRDFAEGGFWQKEEGLLLVLTSDEELAGHIEFFKAVSYWDAFELSYQLYDERFAGRGYMTEAVQLVVDYLFGNKKAAPHPSRDRPREPRVAPDRREVRLPAGGDRPRCSLHRRPQPGRPPLLAAADRSSTLARGPWFEASGLRPSADTITKHAPCDQWLYARTRGRRVARGHRRGRLRVVPATRRAK